MLVILGLATLVVLLLWMLTSPFYWKIRNIPYITPLPIFGSYFPMFKLGLVEFFKLLHANYPGHRYYGAHFFTRPALVIKDPELIQRIMVTDFDHFTSHGVYGNQDRDPFGANLFHVQGQQWKELRGKLSQFFTPNKVKTMQPYIENSLERLITIIDRDVANNKPTDFKRLFFNAVINVVCQAIFGIESDVFEREDSMFSQVAVEMFRPKFTASMFTGVISPKIFDLLRVNTFAKSCTDYIRNVVSQTVEYRKREKLHKQDFVQSMIELMDNYKDSGEKYFPDHTRVPRYDFDNFVSQSILLYGAGVETSSTTLTFFFYELAMHPEAQEKCRMEINEITPENGIEITLADVSKLVYTGAALQESLRLHSPFSVITRECTKNYQIPDSQTTIESGTFVMIMVSGLHYDPTYYPDPYAFKPERFLNGNTPKRGTYMPFGLGPRTCVGMALANSQIKLIAARLLQRYEIAISPLTSVPLQEGMYNALTTPAGDVYLQARPIVA